MKRQIGRLLSHSVVKFGSASVLARGIAITGVIILTPLVLTNLGSQSYAYWILATQLPGLLISPDLGMGQGTQNALNEEFRRTGNTLALRKRVASVQRVLRIIASGWMALGLIAMVAYTKTSETPELLTPLLLGLACFTSGIPATIWTKVQLSHEHGHTYVTFEAGARTVSLILAVLVLLTLPSLELLVVASLLPPSVALYLNSVHARRRYGGYSGKLGLREALRESRGSMSLGARFLVLQICYVLNSGVDPFIVAGLANTAELTYISVSRRPFDALPLILTLFTTSLWPIFSRLAVDSPSRLRLFFLRLMAFGLAAMIVAGIVIMILRSHIYPTLSARTVDPSALDLALITLLTASTAAVLVMTVLLSAIGELRAQILVVVPATFVLLPLKTTALLYGGTTAFLTASSLGHLLLITAPLFVRVLRSRQLSTDLRVGIKPEIGEQH